MREVEAVRRLAPAVTPPAADELERMRVRALGHRRRVPSPALLLAPLAAAVVLAVVLVGARSGGGEEREFAAPVMRAAEGAPRLLLDGWRVTRVDEWSAGTGEMRFTRGGRALELSWLPARAAGSRIAAAKEAGPRPELRVTVAGARADVWRYAGSDEYSADWRAGDAAVVLRGRAESAEEFGALVRRLRPVAAEAWLAALPASAVTPAEHRDAVDAMLTGLPLPPGLDVEALRRSAATRDRYQLGALVAGTVACGWFERWAAARAAGDAAAERRATEALASSRGWPVLREMDAEGAYPEVLWEYAAAAGGRGTVAGGKTLDLADAYRSALCPS